MYARMCIHTCFPGVYSVALGFKVCLRLPALHMIYAHFRRKISLPPLGPRSDGWSLQLPRESCTLRVRSFALHTVLPKITEASAQDSDARPETA